MEMPTLNLTIPEILKAVNSPRLYHYTMTSYLPSFSFVWNAGLTIAVLYLLYRQHCTGMAIFTALPAARADDLFYEIDTLEVTLIVTIVINILMLILFFVIFSYLMTKLWLRWRREKRARGRSATQVATEIEMVPLNRPVASVKQQDKATQTKKKDRKRDSTGSGSLTQVWTSTRIFSRGRLKP